MKLIFGLGNPEERYNSTRHNVGYWLVDAAVDARGLSWQHKTKFKALIAEQGTGNDKIVFAKPLTYYNLVGESLQSICSFYEIEPSDVLIVADDLALPFGTIRLRTGGSAGGNNGIKSINAHGGQDTKRLRIGVSNDLTERIDSADFVLNKFSKNEQAALRKNQEVLLGLIDQFTSGEFTETTHRLD